MFNIKNQKSIEEFAATIAHEIKNPLSLVKANIDLLEHADMNNLHSKNYNLIKKELDKINNMMMDFLDLTKVSNRVYDIVYLHDLILEIINNYNLSHQNKIIIRYECDNEELMTLANEQDLYRAIANAIKNSIEAIEENFGEIFINVMHDETFIYLTIEDNGVGLNDTSFEKITEPFYTTKSFGSGLGVCICKKIMEELNGEFSLKNNDNGIGCTAFFKFIKYI